MHDSCFCLAILLDFVSTFKNLGNVIRENTGFEIWHHWKNLWTCYENGPSKTFIHNTQWYSARWKTKRKAIKEVVRWYKEWHQIISLAEASRMAQIREKWKEVVQRIASFNIVGVDAINWSEVRKKRKNPQKIYQRWPSVLSETFNKVSKLVDSLTWDPKIASIKSEGGGVRRLEPPVRSLAPRKPP